MAETSQPYGAGSLGTTGQQPQGRRQFGEGKSDSSRDQAESVISQAENTASEMWDEATEQGRRYYREGTQALRNVDSSTITNVLIAGAVGYFVAWLVHGQQSYSGQSGGRYQQPGYRPDYDDHSRRNEESVRYRGY